MITCQGLVSFYKCKPWRWGQRSRAGETVNSVLKIVIFATLHEVIVSCRADGSGIMPT